MSRVLSQRDAEILMATHEIEALLDNEEETDLLEEHNPELLNAYLNLQAVADGSD